MTIIRKIYNLISVIKQKKKDVSKTSEIIGNIINEDMYFYNKLHEISRESSEYHNNGNMVFLKELNAYGVFNFSDVKDFMFSNDFGISPMHISLNHIYFQYDSDKKTHNKKVVLKKLDFLAKEFQFKNNEFTNYIFNLLLDNFPRKEKFNIVEYLINPLVFLSALNDLGFLKIIDKFNPDSCYFDLKTTLREVNEIFNNKDYLNEILEKELNYKDVPVKMTEMLKDFLTEEPYQKTDLPQFFASLIFAAVETTASFLTTFLYFIFTEYNELLKNKNPEKLHNLANELLRIYVPTPFTFRTVQNNLNFKGVDLKKGDLIILFIYAANTDPNFFDDPLKIKLDRTEKHLSFGRGKLACIGQYASFRLAMNVFNYISNYNENLKILDEAPSFVNESVYRISEINVLFYDEN